MPDRGPTEAALINFDPFGAPAVISLHPKRSEANWTMASLARAAAAIAAVLVREGVD